MQAFVFPGQGSQAIGMLADLANEYSIVQDTFDEASTVLDFDLWQLIQHGTAEQLNATQVTQPALLASSVAIYRTWLQQGGQAPKAMAGHSLGEYSALACAGVIDFVDAIRLVELRGQFMQQAVPAGIGGMAAIIGLDDDKVIASCIAAAGKEVVSAVNFNSPGQVVIAGHAAAVERAGVLCKEAGAKRALPLPVSVPSHCALMQPAADKLAEILDAITFSKPSIAVINNVDVTAESEPAAIKQALIRQLYSPVRWTESVQKLVQQGLTTQFEIGPGKVLTGLAKRIEKSVECSAVNTADSLQAALQE